MSASNRLLLLAVESCRVAAWALAARRTTWAELALADAAAVLRLRAQLYVLGDFLYGPLPVLSYLPGRSILASGNHHW